MNPKRFLILATSLILVGMLSSCGSYQASEAVKSPDGTKALNLFVKDGGAALASRVYINLALPSGQEKEKIFEGSGGWPLEVKWINRDLALIKYCGAQEIEYNPTIYYEENGIPREVKIILVTQSSLVDAASFGMRACVDN